MYTPAKCVVLYVLLFFVCTDSIVLSSYKYSKNRWNNNLCCYSEICFNDTHFIGGDLAWFHTTYALQTLKWLFSYEIHLFVSQQ